MYNVKEEFVSSSKSHCKVGKVTSRKDNPSDCGTIRFDFKTEAFKESTTRFTEKIKTL